MHVKMCAYIYIYVYMSRNVQRRLLDCPCVSAHVHTCLSASSVSVLSTTESSLQVDGIEHHKVRDAIVSTHPASGVGRPLRNSR